MNTKTEQTCPRCLKNYTDYPALSRRDNKTNICSACGTEEAIIDMGKSKLPMMIQTELKFLTKLIREKK